MKHTQEPWTCRQEFANRWRIEKHKEGYVPLSLATVATTLCEVGVTNENNAANAQRIVACVNALAGIPTEALNNGAVQQLIEATKKVVDTCELCFEGVISVEQPGQYLPTGEPDVEEIDCPVCLGLRTVLDSINVEAPTGK